MDGLTIQGATRTSLALPESLTHDEWRGLGTALTRAEQSVMWWLGDWLRYGERRWGEKYRDAMEATGAEYQTLANAKWVAERFDVSRRRENLSWSHHAEVAALEPVAADGLLERAERERLSRRALRELVSQWRSAQSVGQVDGQPCTVDDLQHLVQRGVRFGTIYADPPWPYDNQATRAATSNHYRCMSMDQLCTLPVAELAAPDAHLHLWATNGFLEAALGLIRTWGFTFKSTFVRCKPQLGLGNYWRNAHEFLLTAIRGDATRFQDRNLRSWMECPRKRHSEKPEEVRAMIELASTGPYLELFGRRSVPGWTVWGDQVDRSALGSAALQVPSCGPTLEPARYDDVTLGMARARA